MRAKIVLSTSIILLACSSGDANTSPTAFSDNLGPASSALGAGFENEVTQTLQPFIDAYNAPGVTAMLLQGDNVIYRHTFGLANTETGQRMSLVTPLYVASISKLFTATALMQLYEQDKFGLDDDVDNYLPYQVRNPAHLATPITIRMLLAHASSIVDNPDVVDGPTDAGYYVGSLPPTTISEFVRSYFDPLGSNYHPENFLSDQPGTVDNYANMNFALAAALFEALSGETLEAYTQEHIFAPLNMDAEWNVFSATNRGAEAPAMGYLVNPPTYDVLATGYYTTSWLGATGLSADGVSLSHFLMAMMNDGVYRGTRIVHPGTMALMQTGQYPSLDGLRGLGYEILYPGMLDESNLYIGHLGGDYGYTSACFYRPSDQRGVIFLWNGDAALWSFDQYINALSMMLALFDAPAKNPHLAANPVDLLSQKNAAFVWPPVNH